MYTIRNTQHWKYLMPKTHCTTVTIPVVGRRKKRGPVPDFIQRRFPPGHPLRCSVSPESGSDSASDDLDLDTIIPTGANVDVHFKLMEGTPGLAVRTSSTQSWTPIAARTRTRARLKK